MPAHELERKDCRKPDEVRGLPKGRPKLIDIGGATGQHPLSARGRGAEVKPLDYHPGQFAVQAEAGTRLVVDKLADWVGPAVDFARSLKPQARITRRGGRGPPQSSRAGY